MKRVLSRILVTSGVMLCASVSTASFAAADGPVRPDAARGEMLYEQGDAARGVIACSSCHGVAGNSQIPLNPNLSAMPHEYLYKQLSEFKLKDGEDVATRGGADGGPSVMSFNVMMLEPQDMQDIALYLSHQELTEPATAENEATVETGMHLWRGGDAARGIPACAACHGASGEGIPAQYPRLGGQHAMYLEEQLKLFRAGYRDNNQVMVTIAKRLSDADIKAIADYAAGLR